MVGEEPFSLESGRTKLCGQGDQTEISFLPKETMSPLSNIARKNVVWKSIVSKQEEFARRNREELCSLEHDEESCVICLSSKNALFRFGQNEECHCMVHSWCIRDARQGEVFVTAFCSACREFMNKEEEMDKEEASDEEHRFTKKHRFTKENDVLEEESRRQERSDEDGVPIAVPTKKTKRVVICGTPFADSTYCCKPRGHLGHCCISY